MKVHSATPCTASYIIFRKGDKIAFLLRENTQWMNGNYSLVAGKVDADETFTDAAIREAHEEAGVTIKPTDLQVVHVMHRRAPDADFVDVFFEASSWQGELRNAEPHKHGELAWFTLNDLPDNMIPNVRAAMLAIRDGQTYSEFGW